MSNNNIEVLRAPYEEFEYYMSKSLMYDKNGNVYIPTEQELQDIYKTIELPGIIADKLFVKAYIDTYFYEERSLIIPLAFKLNWSDKCYINSVNNELIDLADYVNVTNIRNNVTLNVYNCKTNKCIKKGDTLLELLVIPRI